jgi:hypothetical protein
MFVQNKTSYGGFRSRRVVAVKYKPCDTHCVSLAIAIAVSLFCSFHVLLLIETFLV